MAPRYVIASNGRSGSGWIAQVLTRAGLACGHEAWWNPHIGCRDRTVLGDSSWMAAAVLDTFEGTVVHQTRHPLDIVRSLAGGWDRTDAYAPLRLAHFTPSGDDLIDAMRIVLAWDALIAPHAERTWQVEHVEPTDLVWLGYKIGVQVDCPTARRAIESVAPTWNRHQSRRDLTWLDLPATQERVDLEALIHRQGYTL